MALLPVSSVRCRRPRLPNRLRMRPWRQQSVRCSPSPASVQRKSRHLFRAMPRPSLSQCMHRRHRHHRQPAALHQPASQRVMPKLLQQRLQMLQCRPRSQPRHRSRNRRSPSCCARTCPQQSVQIPTALALSSHRNTEASTADAGTADQKKKKKKKHKKRQSEDGAAEGAAGDAATATAADPAVTSELQQILAFDKQAFRREKRQKQRAKLRTKQRTASLVCGHAKVYGK